MSDSRTAFTSLLKHVVFHLKDCPQELILLNAVEVAREFCGDSGCWRYNHDPIYVRSAQTDYELDDKPCNTEIVAVIDPILLDGQRLYQDRGDYYLSDRTLLRLARATGRNIAKALKVEVTLRPSEAATDIDARIYGDYHLALADGVIWKMCAMPEKPWSNGNLAAYHQAEYLNKLAKCRIDMTKGGAGMTKTLQMRPRYKFA